MTKTETTKPKPTVARTELASSSVRKSSSALAQTRAKSDASAPRTKNEQPLHTGQPTSKLSNLIGMLRDKRGASIDQLTAATGWQKHSVRGAISGAIKKRLGLNIVSEQTDAGRVYRIVK